LARRGKLAAFVLLAFALCSCVRTDETSVGRKLAADEPPVVAVDVDKAVITIGERVRYRITIESNPALTCAFPEFGENLAGFAIMDFRRGEPRINKWGNRVESQWYLLDTYIVADYPIPAATVTYSTEGSEEQKIVQAPQIGVVVSSVLPTEAEKRELKDIKPPLEVPRDYGPYYIALAVVVAVVCAVLAGVVIVVRRRRKAEEEGPRETPAEAAYRQLEYLRSLGLVEKGDYEQYYVLLSGIARHYLENRFGLRAPEMTTEEFFDVASRSTVLREEHRSLVSAFLEHCDMVKFARYGPSPEEAAQAFGAAVRLVDETSAEPEDGVEESREELVAVGVSEP